MMFSSLAGWFANSIITAACSRNHIDFPRLRMYQFSPPEISAMPWTCPKCGLHVGHGNDTHPLPASGELYRCPVCHLELTFDSLRNKTIPAPPPKQPDPRRTDAA